MCGICGWLNIDDQEPIDKDTLVAMTDTLAHRGPDGYGYHFDNHFGMGHRRLSIIDLETGKQPLSNEDGTIWVSFNGEIYNYLELMHSLAQKGHRFSSNSDTEVLVHLYEEKGVEMLTELRGMFAFAIWDSNRKRLFIARDRLGKKPLFYSWQDGNRLLFASEIKAILASGRIVKDVDLQALDQYLSFLYVPTPTTIFKGIQKLPAGHYMTIENGSMRIEQYWDLIYPHTEQTSSKNEAKYLEEFEDILSEAVKIRMRSDVPLGAFLSGGVDSSAVVSLMSDHHPGMVETLSIGFPEEGYDELQYAKIVADKFDCRYNEFQVKANTADIIPTLLTHFDEPFADPSFVPTYYVSKAARQKATVVLSGDGGDESMAGYPRHKIELLEQNLRRYSKYLPSKLWHILYRSLPPGTKGRNIFGNISCCIPEAAARKHSNLLFSKELKELIYNDTYQMSDCSAWLRTIYNNSTATNPLDKLLYLDMKSYLHDDILVKVDRMSMAVGLEVRAPLLDHKVLEFLATVPPHLKLNSSCGKYLLKKVLESRLPKEIIHRKKQGFRLPIEMWLKQEMRPVVEELLGDGRLQRRGLFNISQVQRLWELFLSGKRDYAHQIWQLVILEMWFRSYIDNATT